MCHNSVEDPVGFSSVEDPVLSFDRNALKFVKAARKKLFMVSDTKMIQLIHA